MNSILLIDDDSATNYYHKEMLLEAGFEKSAINAFEDAGEAISFLESLQNQGDVLNRPQIVVVDVNMPIINGFEFVEVFQKSCLYTDQCKIILVTSSKNPKDEKKAEENPYIHSFETKYLEVDFFLELKEALVE